MRRDPLLNTFIDEMPNLEAAARRLYYFFRSQICRILRHNVVSAQTVSQTVTALVTGLEQVKAEIRQVQQLRTQLSDDRFVQVMQVSPIVSSFLSSF